MTTWSLGQPGVLALPDGTLVRGRGLRRGLPDGDVPELGLYLLGREPEPSAWEAAWIPWPDFRTPRDRALAHRLITDAHARAAEMRVEVACGGGRGRTGTALACMATLAGLLPRDAVTYVRERYDRHAIETPFQRRFVAWFAAQPG